MEKRIILIGGTPTAGKSTIAEAVAKHYNLPWISSDQIRMVMQSVANRDEHPALFAGMDMTADEYFQQYSIDDVVQQEYDYGEEVWPGIRKFIDTGWVWREGCIIEGVSILPNLVAMDYANKPHVKAVFLSDTDSERIREVVFKRGLFTHPERYSDETKEKEIEWVQIFDKVIRREAEEHHFPIVDISKNDQDIRKVLQVLE